MTDKSNNATMTYKNYSRGIQRIARANISKGYDVGDGRLFGFSIKGGAELNTIVQVDIATDSEDVPIYILPYRWADKERGIIDHDDTLFSELTSEEQGSIYDEFKNKYGLFMENPITYIHGLQNIREDIITSFNELLADTDRLAVDTFVMVEYDEGAYLVPINIIKKEDGVVYFLEKEDESDQFYMYRYGDFPIESLADLYETAYYTLKATTINNK